MEFLKMRARFHDELSLLFEVDEIDAFFYRLTEACCGYKRIMNVLQPQRLLSEQQMNYLFDALSELKREKPIQYILHKADFYGLEFYVNEQVLIPRPETEELTDWIIKDQRRQHKAVKERFKIIDVGTGSGCVAITLAKHIPKAEVHALDISVAALEVARKNMQKHDVNINFRRTDALQWHDEAQKYTVVVANPPYVSISEKKEMKNNVLHYEPHNALFVPDEDPLIFYKKITSWAWAHLEISGALYFEINPYFGLAVKSLMEASGFMEVELRRDLSGHDRMLKGLKTKA